MYVHMHVHGGVTPGVIMETGWAWARLLGCKLNGTLGGTVLTCGYAGGIGYVWLGVGGQQGRQQGGGEVRGLAGPIAVVGGLWARLQVSVKYMQYM